MSTDLNAQSIVPISPGPLLTKLRRAMPILPLAEESSPDENLSELKTFLSQPDRTDDAIEKAAETFREIFGDDESDELLEQVFNEVDDDRKRLLFLRLSLECEDGFSDFFCEKLDEEEPVALLATDIVISIRLEKLTRYIRTFSQSLYGDEVASALLKREDCEFVLETVKDAVFNPEIDPSVDEGSLDEASFGRFYREPQSLYASIIDHLAPEYDLSEIEDFYRIVIEDDNLFMRSELTKVLVEKYGERAKKLFLNVARDKKLVIFNSDSELKKENLVLRKAALWSFAKLMKDKSINDLVQIVQDEDPNIGIEAVKILCDESITGPEGFEKLKEEIVKAENRKIIFIVALVRYPTIIDDPSGYTPDYMKYRFGTENPCINKYMELVSYLLSSEDINLIDVLQTELDIGALNEVDFNIDTTPLKSLIEGIGLDQLALWATCGGETQEALRLKQNAEALLLNISQVKLRYFLERGSSNAAEALRTAIGFGSLGEVNESL